MENDSTTATALWKLLRNLPFENGRKLTPAFPGSTNNYKAGLINTHRFLPQNMDRCVASAIQQLSWKFCLTTLTNVRERLHSPEQSLAQNMSAFCIRIRKVECPTKLTIVLLGTQY